MKILHKESELFTELSMLASNHYKIDVDIIKHDYFVSYVLKAIVEGVPNIIFKGGTSLSKCFRKINRYSEDIDLTIEENDSLTVGKLKELNRKVLNLIQELEFEITNIEDFKSGRKNNTYIGKLDNNTFSNKIKIETFFSVKSYPKEKCFVYNYIYLYLKEIGRLDILKDYNTTPFNINVQSKDRTFIDKTFAICDYFLRKEAERNSRHLYDLHKLVSDIEVNDKFYKLFEDVRIDRKKLAPRVNLSAQEGFNIISCLNIIKEKSFYKSDYNNITNNLLFEDVSYEESVKVIDKIIDILHKV
ncbi:MAG: nucleotidyl transferase AbiEii/AbiGii toxin family protein [Bacillota bacterium]